MHATELPKPFHLDGWVYEEKYDGWLMVAGKAGSEVALTSRNGLDHTRRFPELVKAIGELDAPAFIFDGEDKQHEYPPAAVAPSLGLST